MYDLELELLDEFDLFDDLDEEIIEESAKEEREIRNRIGIVYQHLLKWKFHQDKQTPSWIDSITNLYYETYIKKNIKASQLNKMTIDDLDKLYITGRSDAIDEENKAGYNMEKVFPKERPYDWDLNFMLNNQALAQFLRQYYNPTYNIDLDHKIKTRLNL